MAHLELSIVAPELDAILTALEALDGRISDMATQAQVDAIGAAITTAVETINTALTGIRADIDTLKQQANVDVGPLEARVAEATAAAQALSDLDTENPPPA